MRTIYTTERIRIDGVRVLGIEELPPGTKAWVNTSRSMNMRTATIPEQIAGRMFSNLDDRPTRQAFFMIRKRCYFLDFFFPRRMLAVEIDGSSHRTKKEHDKKRDADFRSIGIRTVRVKNKDVMEGKLFERLAKRLWNQRQR